MIFTGFELNKATAWIAERWWPITAILSLYPLFCASFSFGIPPEFRRFLTLDIYSHLFFELLYVSAYCALICRIFIFQAALIGDQLYFYVENDENYNKFGLRRFFENGNIVRKNEIVIFSIAFLISTAYFYSGITGVFGVFFVSLIIISIIGTYIKTQKIKSRDSCERFELDLITAYKYFFIKNNFSISGLNMLKIMIFLSLEVSFSLGLSKYISLSFGNPVAVSGYPDCGKMKMIFHSSNGSLILIDSGFSFWDLYTRSGVEYIFISSGVPDIKTSGANLDCELPDQN